MYIKANNRRLSGQYLSQVSAVSTEDVVDITNTDRRYWAGVRPSPLSRGPGPRARPGHGLHPRHPRGGLDWGGDREHQTEDPAGHPPRLGGPGGHVWYPEVRGGHREQDHEVGLPRLCPLH